MTLGIKQDNLSDSDEDATAPTIESRHFKSTSTTSESDKGKTMKSAKKNAKTAKAIKNENQDDNDDSGGDGQIKKEEESEGANGETKVPVKEEADDKGNSLPSSATNGRKKRKGKSQNAVKTEESIKEEEVCTPNKKAKRPRVSEAVIKDAEEKMLKVLIKVSPKDEKSYNTIKNRT